MPNVIFGWPVTLKSTGRHGLFLNSVYFVPATGLFLKVDMRINKQQRHATLALL